MLPELQPGHRPHDAATATIRDLRAEHARQRARVIASLVALPER
jgi:hypothetical protein